MSDTIKEIEKMFDVFHSDEHVNDDEHVSDDEQVEDTDEEGSDDEEGSADEGVSDDEGVGDQLHACVVSLEQQLRQKLAKKKALLKSLPPVAPITIALKKHYANIKWLHTEIVVFLNNNFLNEAAEKMEEAIKRYNVFRTICESATSFTRGTSDTRDTRVDVEEEEDWLL